MLLRKLVQHKNRLSPSQQKSVLDFINRVKIDFSHSPISEHILLHLRYGGDKADSHLLVEKDNQVIGYAHLDKLDRLQTQRMGQLLNLFDQGEHSR